MDMYSFLEYVPGGSIGSCLLKHGKFDEEVTKSFTGQILDGLEYLHSKGILHRVRCCSICTYCWNNLNGVLGFESGQHPCREIGCVQDIRLWNIQTHRRYGRRYDGHERNRFLDGARGYQLPEERLQLQN